MGMTDNQFASFRRMELKAFEELMAILVNSNADSDAIEKLQGIIDDAKKDIEK